MLVNNMASGEEITNWSSSIEDTEIVSVVVPDSSTHLTVTVVLNYCKKKILIPYLRYLSFIGFRPLLNDQQGSCFCGKLLNFLYTCLIIVVMLVGYMVHYMACFRRDRGFYYVFSSSNNTLKAAYDAIFTETCDRPITFTFVLPSLLHLSAYLHTLIVFRNTDDEQLPVLMERVFLASTNLSDGFISQRKLVKILWLFVMCSLVWISVSFIISIFMLVKGDITFRWIENGWLPAVSLKILFVVCTLWQDLIQSAIISNYCLQAQLLTSHVRFMRDKLLQFPVQPLEWMRDIEDFKKLLNHFNKKISPSVCLLLIMDISFALSGALWLYILHVRHISLPIHGLSAINILNVFFWAIIAIAPIIQAARLSNSCKVLKTVGQEVRARPYVHQDTPIQELDSVLLYTTSLNIDAKLFCISITGRSLIFCITLASVVFLVLGQSHYFLH
ncbi:uncharacterized protein LOC130900817 [Diorhabda carinulata]|uniref:uncharacterized protein LOC130900817 n=1 Tax=Diorhabda carinulata TaxID=1163345 RepID=UPI0025A28FAF|nr:uncharacterized protein LOC130900817 [Diorhabda carinulata]